MSDNIRYDSIDDSLGDEALDAGRDRFCEYYTRSPAERVSIMGD